MFDETTLNLVAVMFITAVTPALTEQLKIYEIADRLAILINVLLAVVLFMILWAVNGAASDEVGLFLMYGAIAGGVSTGGHTVLRNGQRRRHGQQ